MTPELPQDLNLTDEQRARIEEFVRETHTDGRTSQFTDSFGPLYDCLVESFAPSIPGFEIQKLALLFALVGGVPRSHRGEYNARGAIHVLIVHDPGTAVTSLVEYCADIAPDGLYCSPRSPAEELLSGHSGPDVSQDSIAAEMSPDTFSSASHAVMPRFDEREWDWFERMYEIIFPESMAHNDDSEAQLEDTTGIIATARPQYGRFDQYEQIPDQIELDISALTLFDLIFTVADIPDERADGKLAEHIIEAQQADESPERQQKEKQPKHVERDVERAADEEMPTLDTEFLKQYITHARATYFPTINEAAKRELEEFYVDLRGSQDDEMSPIPATSRSLQTLVRLSEASARLRLSTTVEAEDAQRAITLTRAHLQHACTNPETGTYDADILETGMSKKRRDGLKTLLGIVENLEDEYDDGAPVDIVRQHATETGMDESKAEYLIAKLKEYDEVYAPRPDRLHTR